MIQPAIYLLCNHSRPCKFKPPETHTTSSSISSFAIDGVSATENNTHLANVGHNSAVSTVKYERVRSQEITNVNLDFSNTIGINGRASQMKSIRGRNLPIKVEMWI